MLLAAGCVAQTEGDVILSRRVMSIWCLAANLSSTSEMVAKITGAYGAERIINTDFPGGRKIRSPTGRKMLLRAECFFIYSRRMR